MAKINRKFAAHKQVSTGSTADMEKLITQLSERDDKEQDASNVKMLRLSSCALTKIIYIIKTTPMRP